MMYLLWIHKPPLGQNNNKSYLKLHEINPPNPAAPSNMDGCNALIAGKPTV